MGKSVGNWKSINLMVLVTIIALLMFLSAIPAFAMGSRPSTEPWKFTWGNSNSGNWSDSDRWNQEKISESKNDYPRYKNDIAILTQGTGPSADTTVTIDIDNIGTSDARLASVSIYSNSNFAYNMILSGSNRNLYTENLYIGLKYDLTAYGKGIYNQSRGTTNVNNLYLGTSNGSNGTYNLSGTRSDRTGTLKVNTIMNIGGGATSGVGVFNLNNFGVLDASTATVTLNNGGTFGYTGSNSSGKATINIFNYNGGTLTLPGTDAGSSITAFNYNKVGSGSSIALPANLNRYDITTFTQTAGDLALNSITLQSTPGHSNNNNTGIYNTYNLQGGSLVVGSIALANGGRFTKTGGTVKTTGTFSQTGGTSSFDELLIDDGIDYIKAYQMSGLTLAAGRIAVTGNGSFTQSDGTTAVTGDITNAGTITISGGSVSANTFSNNGTFNFSGGTLSTSSHTFENTGTSNLSGTVSIGGPTINAASGTFNVTNATATFDDFTNYGVYISTSSTQTFNKLTVNSGTLSSDVGSTFIIKTDFTDSKTSGTTQGTLRFDDGTTATNTMHTFAMSGTETWDTLEIANGDTLYLNGTSLDVNNLLLIDETPDFSNLGAITTLVQSYLNGATGMLFTSGQLNGTALNLTVLLNDGGSAQFGTGSSVPLPGTLLMLGTGLIGLLGIRRRYTA